MMSNDCIKRDTEENRKAHGHATLDDMINDYQLKMAGQALKNPVRGMSHQGKNPRPTAKVFMGS